MRHLCWLKTQESSGNRDESNRRIENRIVTIREKYFCIRQSHFLLYCIL